MPHKLRFKTINSLKELARRKKNDMQVLIFILGSPENFSILLPQNLVGYKL